MDDLRKLGCPCIHVPGTKKILFNPDRVVTWLEEQSTSEDFETMTVERASAKADEVFGRKL